MSHDPVVDRLVTAVANLAIVCATLKQEVEILKGNSHPPVDIEEVVVKVLKDLSVIERDSSYC